MTETTPDFIRQMPDMLKPMNLGIKPKVSAYTQSSPQVVTRKKLSRGKIVGWALVLAVAIIAAVQYINAAKYSALVQVISQDRIGVNPTGNALDFGDLPRNKSAIRTVELKSSGNMSSYIMVWMFGSIGDLLKVDQNYFTLKPKSDVKLQFTANIPNSAAYQYYRGRVIIFQIPKIW